MAYAQAKTRNEKLASAGIVAALHVGIGALLVTTFAGGIETVISIVNPRATNIPEDNPLPPPPPTAQASDKPAERTIDVPEARFTLAPIDGQEIVIPKPPLGDSLGGGTGTLPAGPAADPSPSPSASFVPRVARPKSNPGTWATTIDYPSRAIREQRQGVTAFRVTVGTDGRVTDCMIIRSSGSQDLDEATCAKVSKRARFEPATDDAGNKVIGSYANSIRWVLPE